MEVASLPAWLSRRLDVCQRWSLEGKFAHTSSRVAAELNAVTKPSLTDAGQQLQLLSLSQLMETGDYEEIFTSRSWGNVFLGVML